MTTRNVFTAPVNPASDDSVTKELTRITPDDSLKDSKFGHNITDVDFEFLIYCHSKHNNVPLTSEGELRYIFDVSKQFKACHLTEALNTCLAIELKIKTHELTKAFLVLAHDGNGREIPFIRVKTFPDLNVYYFDIKLTKSNGVITEVEKIQLLKLNFPHKPDKSYLTLTPEQNQTLITEIIRAMQ